MYYVLLYELVDDVLTARAPYREEHLRRAAEAHEKGLMVMGGALTDPPDAAILVFRTDERSEVEAWAEGDPYVINGVVTGWKVRPWMVVIPSD